MIIYTYEKIGIFEKGRSIYKPPKAVPELLKLHETNFSGRVRISIMLKAWFWEGDPLSQCGYKEHRSDLVVPRGTLDLSS